MSAEEFSIDRESVARSLHDVRRLVGSAWLSIALVVFGCAVLVGSMLYSLTQLRPLERQVEALQLASATAVQRRDDAIRELEQARADVKAARTELEQLVAEIAALKEQRDTLQQIKDANELSIAATKEKAANLPVDPADVAVANSDTPPADRARIDALVDDLFAPSGSRRTAAYNELTTTKLRAERYAVERILERGSRELSKPDGEPDFVGVYNTIVTLTDMSRAVTQLPDADPRIREYGDRASERFPRLQNRVQTLKRWLDSVRR